MTWSSASGRYDLWREVLLTAAVTLARGIRLAVLDDGLFVRTYAGEIRPLSATFNRFVEAVARSGQFEHVRYVVPVRHLRIWEVEPALEPVDESAVEIVPTTFFSGIADYLMRAGYLAARNWGPIERTIAEADLLWLRLPASNALLALAAARRHGIPYFSWLAGSVAGVARAQHRPPPLGWAAQAVGRAYDAVSELAGRGGPMITLDAELFASVVVQAETEQTQATVAPVRGAGPWRILWAGRMAGEKGLPELVEAIRLLLESEREVTLVLVGDGPARPMVERLLARLPAERVEDHGYVGDRATFMQLLRGGDVLVHPSRTEGVPKVLVEAMAAGLPIIAAGVGATRDILGDGERGRIVHVGDPGALAEAVRSLLDDPHERSALRERALTWAADHTAEMQARRLVAWMREHFADLPWLA